MRLLLAEDDTNLRGVLERGLKEEGYVVDAVANGDEALDYLRAYEYAVCILDWRMPGTSGLDVIASARRRGTQTPFLMLTAKDAPPDRIRALDEGADDYLVKPFDYGELLARLRALLRRPSGDRSPLLRCGSLSVDPATHQTLVGGEPADLTPREFAIIELLMRKSPAVVARRSIALHAWPEEADAVGSNTIDVHIARLRAKLARSDARIETLRGTGYRVTASSA
ncbi:MAG: response regulator transcription factor [Acidimicrobiales bacterium]|jgi:DNA-binding response OmpR family regulator